MTSRSRAPTFVRVTDERRVATLVHRVPAVGGYSMDIVQIVVVVLIVLFVLGYFGRSRFRA